MTEELAPEPKKKPGRPRKKAEPAQPSLELPVAEVVPAPQAAPAPKRPRRKAAVAESAAPEAPLAETVAPPVVETAPEPARRKPGRPRKEKPAAAEPTPQEVPVPATPEPVPVAEVATEVVPEPASRPARPGRDGREGRGKGRKGRKPAPRQAEAPLAEDGGESRPDLVDDDSAFEDDSEAGIEAPAAASSPKGRRRKGKERGGKEQDGGLNWCTRRWLEQLEKYAHGNDARQRWARGKVYARRGQVVELEVGPNGVLAKVQGSRPKPYQVRMELNKLRREAWGRVLIAVSGKAHYTARLLAGEMPSEIEAIFASSGARLFPSGDQDFRCKCSCPDPLVPCKHVAAVYHAMAAALDDDPFLLFSMRGKSKNQFLQDLRDMRFRAQKGGKQSDYTQEEVAQMASFWRMGRLNDAVFAHVPWEGSDPARLLHTLGDPPPTVVRAGMAVPVFESTYRQVSEAVLRLPRDL